MALSSARPTTSRASFVTLLAVTAVALLAHLPALANDYVLDDRILLVDNPFVVEPSGIWELLRSELFRASGSYRSVPYYRPLSGALYWLSYRLFGDSAPWQHALNLLLHALVSVQLFRVLRRADLQLPVATTLAAVFAAHPATPDVVAYVGGRQDMMGWLVVLTAMHALLEPRRSALAQGAMALAATAIAASFREFFLTAPALFAAASLTPPLRAGARRAVPVVLGGGVGILLVLLLRHLVGVASFRMEALAASAIVQTAAGVALRLLGVSVWPTDVSVDVTLADVGLAGSVAVLLSLVAAGVLLVRTAGPGKRLGLAAAGVATILLSVVLHTPVALKYRILSDRYAYGVVLGLCLALAPAAERSAQTVAQALRPSLRLAIAGALVLALVPLTWARASEWKDEASLQAAMYRSRPDDPESQLAEGIRRFRAGELDAAFPLCLAHSKAKPNIHQAGLCLGAIYLSRGEPAKAARALEPYAFERPGNLEARVRLFQAWFAAGDLDGIRRGLAYFEPMWPGAPELASARQELERVEATRPGEPPGP